MKIGALLEFLDSPITIGWDTKPKDALAFLRSRGLSELFSYADMVGEERAAASVIAKMMDTDLLATVHQSLIDAAERGTPYQEWARSITPMLQEKGWWGRREVIDPATGLKVTAQLGAPYRLQTIFRTNMQTAYAVGMWQQIAAQAQDAPYLLYDAVDDHRTRPDHAAWDGTVLPVSHPWWRTHTPPNGWNCRCSIIQLSKDDLDDLGLQVTAVPAQGTYDWTNPRTGKVERIPLGIDPGFDHNPGAKRLEELRRLAGEKIEALPAEIREAGREGLRAAQRTADLQFNASTAAGAWHVKSWRGAQEWLMPIVVREQAVNVTTLPGGAYATFGSSVNMPPAYTTASLEHLATWRHKFGHILDVRIGSLASSGGTRALGRVSAGDAFTNAMRADARDLIKQAHMGGAKDMPKRAELVETYRRLQPTLIDMTPEGRREYLQQRAGALGIDLAALRAELKANSAALFDTLAGDIRMARILEAIERRDVERFVAEAAGMDTTGQLVGASVDDRRAHFIAVRDSWNKGMLGSFADLIGAATRNKLASVGAGFPGHTEAYYRKRAGFGQQTEAFANLTASAGAPSALWWELARRFFPRMAREFERIVRNGD